MTATGRPLRALGLLVAGMMLWFAIRLPGLQHRYAEAMQAVQLPGAIDLLVAKIARLAPLLSADARTSVPRSTPAASAPLGPHAVRAVGAPRRRAFAMSDHAERPGSALATTNGVDATPSQLTATPEAESAAIPGFDAAAKGYAALAIGDRRRADAWFGAAIASARTVGGAPQLGAWEREKVRLNRRWSGDAYALFRDAGIKGAAASPVLGGGQSGVAIAYAHDPLARRPLVVFARVFAAHDNRNLIDGDTAQAAIGVRWQPISGVTVAAERLVAIGGATQGDWNLRVAGGGERKFGRLLVDGYGEAGVRGNSEVYAGAQARVQTPIVSAGTVAITGGPAVWGSFQSAQPTVSRFDIGVGVTGRLPTGLAISADWRWRVAGNAAPTNGPALTISMAF